MLAQMELDSLLALLLLACMANKKTAAQSSPQQFIQTLNKDSQSYKAKRHLENIRQCLKPHRRKPRKLRPLDDFMRNQTYLIELLKECSEKLSDAYENTGDESYLEIANFSGRVCYLFKKEKQLLEKFQAVRTN